MGDGSGNNLIELTPNASDVAFEIPAADSAVIETDGRVTRDEVVDGLTDSTPIDTVDGQSQRPVILEFDLMNLFTLDGG